MSRHRNFCFTGFGEEPDELPEGCVYLAYGKEVCPKTFRIHQQGFLRVKNAMTQSAAIKKFNPWHIEPMMGSIEDSVKYCSKESELIEFGERPMSNDDKGRAEKLRWKKALDNAKGGNIEDIDADIQLRYYNTLKTIKMDYMKKPEKLDDVCGIWIYGESGSGKTSYVDAKYPEYFVKPRSKWWNGYQMQPVVCMDDIGTFEAPKLASFLKDWAGQFPFNAESKGSAMIIRPTTFIVTSQYKIDELWSDRETRDALNRRFKKIRCCRLSTRSKGGSDVIKYYQTEE